MALNNYNIDELHIAKSALTDKVYAGFLNSDKKSFNKKKDITGDFMKAVVEKYAGYKENFTLNNKEYEIIVKEVRG